METTKFNIVPVIFNPSPSILCAVNLDGKIPQRTNIQQRLLNRNQDVNCLLGNLRKLSFARNFLEVVYFQFSGNSLSEFSGNFIQNFSKITAPPLPLHYAPEKVVIHLVYCPAMPFIVCMYSVQLVIAAKNWYGTSNELGFFSH